MGVKRAERKRGGRRRATASGGWAPFGPLGSGQNGRCAVRTHSGHDVHLTGSEVATAHQDRNVGRGICETLQRKKSPQSTIFRCQLPLQAKPGKGLAKIFRFSVFGEW